jgi:hypothetical protein
MPSPKYIRGYLSSIGIDSTLGDAFHARANALYGDGGWDVCPTGIVAGGKLVVPAAAYMTFIYGIAAPVAAKPVEVESESAEDEDEKPVSRRRHR